MVSKESRLKTYIEQVLEALTFDGDWIVSFRDFGDLSYSTKTERFLVYCSDTFYWACSDLEAIEIEDLPLLKQSLLDAWDVEEGDDYGMLLWVCRKRKMRPMDQLLTVLPDKVRELFEAAGPERPKHDEDAIWHGKEGVHG